jgi:hypothetical protein
VGDAVSVGVVGHPRWKASMARNQLVDFDGAASVAIEDRADGQWLEPECHADADDELVDRHLIVAVAIPGTRVCDPGREQRLEQAEDDPGV